MQFKFHRDIFEQIKDSLAFNTVIFLLGTRKCGKTVCLKQLSNCLATEFSIALKHNTCFDLLPNYFTNILLTRDKGVKQGNLLKIPYFNFIHELSRKNYVNCEPLHEVNFGKFISEVLNVPQK